MNTEQFITKAMAFLLVLGLVMCHMSCG